MIHGHESLAFSWERRSPQFRDIPPKNYSFRKKFIIWDLFHEKGHNACIFNWERLYHMHQMAVSNFNSLNSNVDITSGYFWTTNNIKLKNGSANSQLNTAPLTCWPKPGTTCETEDLVSFYLL